MSSTVSDINDPRATFPARPRTRPPRRRRLARNNVVPSAIQEHGDRRRRPTVSRRSRITAARSLRIYDDRWGLATTVKVHGHQREARFPLGAPLKTIRARRDELRASLRTLPRPAAQGPYAHLN